ncbi:hypothetical protein LEMLEM_LOCUS16729 [Lemmus lemmus]
MNVFEHSKAMWPPLQPTKLSRNVFRKSLIVHCCRDQLASFRSCDRTGLCNTAY